MLAVPAARARAAVSLTPCSKIVGALCGTVTVPLDYSGQVSGTIPLRVAKVPALDQPSQGTFLVLPGGPGQSSLPIVDDLRDVFHSIVQHYDLVVYDSRGTGSSAAIDCPDLQSGISHDSAACAARLGAARSLYTTQETVADLESVRAALNIPTMSLYGVSFGTKVARAYALTYPTRVQRLILDSAVPATGPDPLMRSTFAALPRVLAGVCAAGACRGVTTHPFADLTKLTGRLARPLHGYVFDGHGKRHRAALTRDEVLGAILASDLDPGFRATLPAAIRSASTGDIAPMLRLFQGGGQAQADRLSDQSDGLFAATTCEEAAFPWPRTSTPAERFADTTAAVAALPAGTYSPFNAQIALGESVIPLCLNWPEAPNPPAIPTGPLAGIPTLIFSGQEDLRTPLEDAQRLQAGIAGSQLVQVADTGHSVLGEALDRCPGDELDAFFAGRPTGSCLDHTGAIPVAPLAPHSLRAAGQAKGVPGPRGHVVAAVGDTLDDASDAFLFAVLNNTVVRFGGLRGGWGRADGSSLTLHRFSYVPGVKLSGRLHLSANGLRGTLKVAAPNGLSGQLSTHPHGVLSGTIGGRHVRDRAHGAIAARLGAARPMSRIDRVVKLAREPRPPRLPLP